MIMRTSATGQRDIKNLEAFRSKAYKDSAGIWTYGYGFIDGVTENSTITQAEADAKFPTLLVPYEAAVNRVCEGVPTTQNQFDAMVSLAYNIGASAFSTSSVAKAHKRGDYLSAQRAFSLWDKITDPVTKKKVVSAGLTNRRNAEALKYGTPDSPEAVEPMPQKVEPETPLFKSPIMQTSVGAGTVTTLLGVASETTGYVRTIRENLGDALVPLLVVAVVGLCAYIAYWRWKQKQQGRA